MKNFKTIVLALAVITTSSLALSAQNFQNKGKEEWRERVLSEKIAFITAKLSLSPEEAQAFWPVYNKISETRDKAFIEVRKSYRDMRKALEAGDEKEISKALDAYVKALDNSQISEKDALAQYRKVLSDEKIAKLFEAEEMFRHQQINRLQKPGNEMPAPNDQRPEGPKPGEQRPADQR